MVVVVGSGVVVDIVLVTCNLVSSVFIFKLSFCTSRKVCFMFR